jgi:carboxypeptidase C (cathepsin A)
MEFMRLAATRVALLAAFAAVHLSGAAFAQQARSPEPAPLSGPAGPPEARTTTGRGARPEADAGVVEGLRRLPPDATTHHGVDLPGRTLRFSATAGSFDVADRRGAPQADVAYIDYQATGAEPRGRAVTFVVNGGPGASSAWLHLGALGPWRLPMADAVATGPSAPLELVPNAESWLDFTDLVFIDPAGTGYSGFAEGGEDARRRLWEVEGDIRSLAEVIRRWVEKNGRAASPQFVVGESYGGFRAPRLVRVLQREHGIAVRGVVLVSPALDFAGRSAAFDPLSLAGRLPTVAAVGRASAGPVARADLLEAERYAAGDYVVDLLRGVRDPETVARASQRVAELTGLEPGWVRRRQARMETGEVLRQLGAQAGRVVSAYDATVTGPDPFPYSSYRRAPDPVLDALTAPLTRAMLELYDGRLDWRPAGRRYEVLNRATNREWDWRRGNGPPEAVTGLRRALALDARLRVVVAHGLYDLVTPYFASQLILAQIPAEAGGDRIHLVAYPGGHMFYAVDASRAALRDEGRALIEGG